LKQTKVKKKKRRVTGWVVSGTFQPWYLLEKFQRTFQRILYSISYASLLLLSNSFLEEISCLSINNLLDFYVIFSRYSSSLSGKILIPPSWITGKIRNGFEEGTL